MNQNQFKMLENRVESLQLYDIGRTRIVRIFTRIEPACFGLNLLHYWVVSHFLHHSLILYPLFSLLNRIIVINVACAHNVKIKYHNKIRQ